MQNTKSHTILSHKKTKKKKKEIYQRKKNRTFFVLFVMISR